MIWPPFPSPFRKRRKTLHGCVLGFVGILDVAALRLRFQKSCGLALKRLSAFPSTFGKERNDAFELRLFMAAFSDVLESSMVRRYASGSKNPAALP
jgi:hypothetical protein